MSDTIRGLMLTKFLKFRSSLTDELEELAEVVDELDSIITTLKSEQVENLSKPLSFLAADEEALKRFNIVQRGILYLQPWATLYEAITTSRTVGSDKLWSNDHMYNQLSFLINSHMNQNEYFSQTVVESFCCRSIAMIPPPQKMIMMQGAQVPAIQPRLSQMDTISGTIDYTAIVTGLSIAECYHVITPTGSHDSQMIAFIASVPKATPDPVHLRKHLPRVLLELVACARHFGKSHIRGALTTGFKWYFVAMDLNADGEGAKYWVSDLIEWREKPERGLNCREYLVGETSNAADPALIAGILSTWIPSSCEEFKGDQWFYPKPSGTISSQQ